MAKSQVAQYMPPQARQVADADGNLSDEWYKFMNNVGFAQGDHIPSVPVTGPTLDQTVAAVNSILAVLIAQKRIASS